MISDKIWTEKYRPDSLYSIILESRIRKLLENLLLTPSSFPSMILHSTFPGTGKTSLARIIANTMKCDTMEINSSEERGIDTIREKILEFSKSSSFTKGIKKCIILQEADGLTKIALDSLKDIMESYSDNCFFLFTCNDLHKISTPIISRCIVMDLSYPNKNDIKIYLTNICEQEKIQGTNIDVIINENYPDIRLMINEIYTSIYGINTNVVTYVSIYKAICTNNLKLFYEYIFNNYIPIMDFNKWLFKILMLNHTKFSKEKLTKLIDLVADTEIYVAMGSNEKIVFTDNALKMMDIFNENKNN